MTAVTVTRSWLRRMAEAVPSAWHHDPVFRWAAIGAGGALALFVLRLAAPPALHGPLSAPGSSVPANLGPTYGTAAAGSPPLPSLPAVLPKIAPDRSLQGVTITPAPEDRFGTAPAANRQ
jgi:hypothetical protein